MDGESVAALAAVMRPTDPELAEAYATTTTAPRVAALCLLHEWASTAAVATAPSSEGGSSQQGGGSGSARGMQAQATEAAAEAWAQLLCLALNDPHLSSSQYAFHGPTHRKKVSSCDTAGLPFHSSPQPPVKDGVLIPVPTCLGSGSALTDPACTHLCTSSSPCCCSCGYGRRCACSAPRCQRRRRRPRWTAWLRPSHPTTHPASSITWQAVPVACCGSAVDLLGALRVAVMHGKGSL